MAARAEPVATPSWYEGRVASWLTTVDHKRIGILYIWTSLVFFGAGGILALLMRAQLAHAERARLRARRRYNELVTIHGTTMVFLVVVPILAGFGNFLVPLMIGARDMAFPRLNALSYWLFLLGGIVLFTELLRQGRRRRGRLDDVPDAVGGRVQPRATASTSGSSRSTSSRSRRSSARSTSS